MNNGKIEYHLALARENEDRGDVERQWWEVKQMVRILETSGNLVAADARRNGMPDACPACGADTVPACLTPPDDYLQLLSVDEEPHGGIAQVSLHVVLGDPGACGHDAPKRHLARAFFRILISRAHERQIEVNFTVD